MLMISLALVIDDTGSEIKRAWYRLCLSSHPDKCGVRDVDVDEANRRTKGINAAYSLLSGEGTGIEEDIDDSFSCTRCYHVFDFGYQLEAHMSTEHAVFDLPDLEDEDAAEE